jgi:hypothetical protein
MSGVVEINLFYKILPLILSSSKDERGGGGNSGLFTSPSRPSKRIFKE